MVSVKVDSICVEDPEMQHICSIVKLSNAIIAPDDLTHSATDDSKKYSNSWALPGANLSMDEFTEEFTTPAAQPLPLPATAESLDTLSDITEGSSISSVSGSISSSLDSKYSADFGFTIPRAAVVEPPIDLPVPDNSKKRKRKKLKENKKCSVCTGTIAYDTDLVKSKCCKNAVCAECMDSMIKVRVTDGQTYIPCPIPNCTKAFKRNFVVRHIKEKETLNKYERFRLNVEPGDNNKKTCPNCCLITESDLPPFNPRKKNTQTPNNYMITCTECTFNWCFNCHSPWHEGLSCASYREGDKQFLKWTKARKKGYKQNCQQCPKCRVYIQKSTGCDSMRCNQCQTQFCYECGGYYHAFPGLGDHYIPLSVLGCPYNYLPEQTAKRRFIRGGYLFAKCAAATGFPILLVGGVAVVAVGAVVLVPIFGCVIAVALIRKKIKGY